jgi:hypothetical protein
MSSSTASSATASGVILWADNVLTQTDYENIASVSSTWSDSSQGSNSWSDSNATSNNWTNTSDNENLWEAA